MQLKVAFFLLSVALFASLVALWLLSPVNFRLHLQEKPSRYALPGCPYTKKPIRRQTPIWQRTSLHTNTSFVFSAYVDSVEQPTVRIIGAVSRDRSPPELFCLLWDEGNSSYPILAAASVSKMGDDHNRAYTASFILCRLPGSDVPSAVSVVSDRCQTPLNLLPVTYNRRTKAMQRNFTVCTGALHSRYDRTARLVEWVEVNRLLGARHSVFYDHSAGANVRRAIRLLAEEGEAEVVPWHLPTVDGREIDIHYFGQLASLNDCLYRNLYRSRFVVVADVDEIIFPRVDDDWASMLASLGPKPGASSFVCRSSFFPEPRGPGGGNFTGMSEAVKYHSAVLLNVRRQKKIFPAFRRSKYIAIPERIVTAGIHYPLQSRRGYSRLVVPTNRSLVFHYRSNGRPATTVPETGMHRYAGTIVRRLRARWETFTAIPIKTK